MSFSSWMRRFRLGRPVRSDAARRLPRNDRRPAFELLEDRLAPATLIVNSNLDTVAPDANLTLREAIAALNAQSNASLSTQEKAQVSGSFGSSDTIQFASSLNGQTITMTGSRLTLGKSVVIDGPGANNLTINGNLGRQIFFIDGRSSGTINVTIDGLTLKRGAASTTLNTFSGGTDNSVRGGAIFNDLANLTIRGCNLTQNSASINGGGVFSLEGTLLFENSSALGNTAGANGSGIANIGGTANIVQSTIRGNTAEFFAGGLFNGVSSLNNNFAGTMTVRQSTVVENVVKGNDAFVGGGIFTLIGCTTFVHNSVVAFNTRSPSNDASDVGSNGTSPAVGGFNYIGSPTSGGLQNGVNGNVVTATVPAFSSVFGAFDDRVTVGVPYLVPSASSPLLNTGDNARVPSGFTLDVRGASRIADGTVDIGAVEGSFVQGPFVVDSNADGDDGNFAAGQFTFREAVRLANENPGEDTIFMSTSPTLTTARVTFTDTALTTVEGNGEVLSRSSVGGTPSFPLVEVEANAKVTVRELDLSNGRNDDFGGAIVNRGTLVISDLDAFDNSASAGGVLYNEGVATIEFGIFANNTIHDADGSAGAIRNVGSLTVLDSQFFDNQGQTEGGAIVNANNGILVVERTLFYGNSAQDGGAIANRNVATVSKSTFESNTATQRGGGVVSRPGAQTNLVGVVLTTNKAGDGGGIANEGTVTLTGATLSENESTGSSGGFSNRGTMTVSRSTIHKNKSGANGGGSVNEGDLTIEFSTFSENTAPGEGGGLFDLNPMANSTIRHSTFMQNTANSGGGASIAGGATSTILASTFSGNSATNEGGGITNAGTLSIHSSTIVSNTASDSGAGVANSTSVTMTNSLVAGNLNGTTPSDLAGTFTGSGNLIGDADSSGGFIHGQNGSIVGNSGSGTIPVANLVGPLLDNGGATKTHALAANSPALDAGTNAAVPAGLVIDQRGLPRISGSAVDIGAVERSQFAGDLVVSTGNDNADGDVSTGNLTLREAILIANDRPGADVIVLTGTSYTLELGEVIFTDVAKTTIEPGDGFAQVVRPSGALDSRIFRVRANAVAEFFDLSISGGKTTGPGGGIQNEGVLTLNRVAVFDNQADGAGGGIANTGTLNVNQSAVFSNTGVGGGGIDNSVGATLNLINSTVAKNSSFSIGGGIQNQGTLTAINATIVENTTDVNRRSLVLDASRGGGIRADGVETLRNTLVAGNRARNVSRAEVASDVPTGGVASLDSVTNSLFGDAATAGGAVHNVAGNVVGNAGSGTLALSAIVGSFNFPGVQANTASYALPLSSPAIDKGSNAAVPVGADLDQRGQARISGNTVDIGAVETDKNGPTILRFVESDIDDAIAVNGTVTYTITFDEDVANGSITAADFDNAGTATLSIGTITETSPGTFSVPVTATTAGTVRLRLKVGAVVSDLNGNSLVVPQTAPTIVNVLSTFAGALVVDQLSDTVDNNFGPGQLSLREAILIANLRTGADSITFADSLSNKTIVLGGSRLVVVDSLTITGPGARRLTVDGNDASQIFLIDGTGSPNPIVVTIQDLTMTRGRTKDVSALNDGGDSGRTAGALVNKLANLTLNRVAITHSHNTLVTGGASAGAIMNDLGGSVLTIRNSTLSENSSASFAGAIYNFGSTLEISDSTISQNIAALSGGGIHNSNGGILRILGSTITLNAADADANATGTGGGISNTLGPVTLFNTLVVGNFRRGQRIDGPGIVGDDIAGTMAAASRRNIISEPASAGGLTNGVNENIVGDGGDTLDVTTILDVGFIAASNSFAANFGLKDNGGQTDTHALVQNSRAIAGGSTTVTGYSAYDQRGAGRELTAPDIGAYEVQHPLTPVGVPSTYADTFRPKGSPDAITAFVRGLYVSTLLREADADGLAIWVGAIQAGRTRTEVAFGFVNSDENRGNQIRFYYRYFLGREADANEVFNVWVPIIQQQDEGAVMTRFALSDEFSGKNNNESFVNLMYYALLGRPAEPQGFGDWMASLNAGATRESVVVAFLRSDESIFRVVDAFFVNYLKRPADAANRNGFYVSIKNGSTFGATAAAILGSSEFLIAADNNR